MIHPKEGYILGKRVATGMPSCSFEGTDVPCNVPLEKETAKRIAISRFCDCIWPIDNIDYLVWRYEENRR